MSTVEAVVDPAGSEPRIDHRPQSWDGVRVPVTAAFGCRLPEDFLGEAYDFRADDTGNLVCTVDLAPLGPGVGPAVASGDSGRDWRFGVMVGASARLPAERP